MKTTEEKALKALAITGSLLNALMQGGTIIEHRFTGWDWFILVKHPKEKFRIVQDSPSGHRAFQYTQFETSKNTGMFEAVHRNGTPREVLGKFRTDFYNSKFAKERAFELGNIK
jgi:hypothetical protein